jgi:phosphate transport system substrate-binding protein
MNKDLTKLFLLLAFSFIFLHCNDSAREKYKDTPVSGDILILADETYQPLIQVQLDTFHSLYKYARIRVRFLPEAEVFTEFMKNDSVRLAITARSLSADEKDYFKNIKIIPRETRIAVDAIAFLVHKSNPDTLLSFDQLTGIVNGTIKTWKEINPESPADSIQLVFDRNGSSTARFLKDSLLGSGLLPANWFAIQSNTMLVDYVSRSPSAIGVIGVNWISDRDDPEVNAFLDQVNVAEISARDTGKTEAGYYKPYQAYIALRKYPLTRDVLILSREGRNGLGTGFASFVAGDQGQRLVRLTGMLPATMPVRIININ